MTTSPEARPVAEDIDLPTLGRALWRAKGWILGLAIGVGVITFVGLSMVRPLYTSEARILIQNDESAFTRPASEQGQDLRERTLDEQAVQSQVQVLTSRDLAMAVVDALDLTNNPDFAKDAGTSYVMQFLKRIGLVSPSARSEQEKAANAFAEHLSVFQLSKSSVIGVDYTSGDPVLAAQIANKLADVYIDWQRKSALEQTKDATAWLSAQIEVLRKKVAESEAAVEQFRSSQGLFSGSNNVTLNAQQLSELNSQLILAKAQQSEAEARARLIKKMLADKGDIDATPEVLQSELIGRLIDQRVQVQRQLAELSATLLPSHPRIKQLNSELADVRTQIRDEAAKIIKSLENQAEVAAAREASLRSSLNEVKSQASGQSEAEIKLRALEREAKAQRDLLESYLARYRDASARHDMGAVPAQAAIVSRAHASILPSFPRRVPMSLLAALATALLALAYVLAREMIAAPGAIRVTAREPEPILKTPRRRAAPIAPAATIAESPRSFAPPEPVMPASVTAPIPEPFMPVPMPAPAAAASSRAEQPELPLPVAASAANADTAAEPKERSFLPFRRANRDKDKNSESKRSESKPTMPERPVSPEAAAVTPTAAGFLERLRRGLSPAGNEAQATQASAESWLGRMRGVRPNEAATDAAEATPDALLEPGPLPTLRTNDLRHYLNQRLAASAAEAANDSGRKAKRETTKTEPEKVGPVLKSLDAVLNHILAKGGAPRALLVAGTSSKVDATTEAISIARALVARREQVLLVDLSRGAAAVSGPLGLPRSPGLSDLSASRASFEDVIRIDPESALQIITAGNPKLASGRDENESFGRVFDALLQAYDTVVLHADRETMRKLTPALKFELPLAVAVLPAGAAQSNTQPDIADFTALGCPVLIYEQNGKAPRSRLFGRVAAV